MPIQICKKCEKKFRCNGSCVERRARLPVNQCLCLQCYKEEYGDDSETWKKAFLERDSCDRRED